MTSLASRIYLAVPYREREQAKKAGSVWDRTLKCWYAEGDVLKESLKQWEPPPTSSGEVDVSEVEKAFAEELKNSGFSVSEPVKADAVIRRVALEGQKKTSASYALYVNDGVPGGWVKNFRTGEKRTWKYKGYEKEPAHVRNAKVAQRVYESGEYEQLDRERVRAGFRAEWEKLPKVENHPYLDKKGVRAHGLRIDSNWQLVVPMRDANDKLVGLQRIDDTGEKKFSKGSSPAAAYHLIGEVRGPTPRILVAEGYSTAATLHELTGDPVVVAFNSGNLPKVAEAIREKYPSADMVIAADDDHHTGRAGPPIENAGRVAAKKASELVGAQVIVPEFTEQEKANGATDYNDWAALRGKESVGKSVSHAIKNVANDTTVELADQAVEPESTVDDAKVRRAVNAVDGQWQTGSEEKENLEWSTMRRVRRISPLGIAGFRVEDLRMDAENRYVVRVYSDENTVAGLMRFRGKQEKEIPEERKYIDGAFAVVGKAAKMRTDRELIVAVTYADALALRKATGRTVLVAFHTKNLLAVAQKARAANNRATIIVAGRNDAVDLFTGQGNVGKDAALHAAAAVDGQTYLPLFTDAEIKQGHRSVSDLLSTRGERDILRQFRAVERVAKRLHRKQRAMGDALSLNPELSLSAM